MKRENTDIMLSEKTIPDNIEILLRFNIFPYLPSLFSKNKAFQMQLKYYSSHPFSYSQHSQILWYVKFSYLLHSSTLDF